MLSDPELDNCFFMAMEDNVDMRFNDVDYKAQLSANGHSRAVMGGVSYPDGYEYLGEIHLHTCFVPYSNILVLFAHRLILISRLLRGRIWLLIYL